MCSNDPHIIFLVGGVLCMQLISFHDDRKAVNQNSCNNEHFTLLKQLSRKIISLDFN